MSYTPPSIDYKLYAPGEILAALRAHRAMMPEGMQATAVLDMKIKALTDYKTHIEPQFPDAGLALHEDALWRFIYDNDPTDEAKIKNNFGLSIKSQSSFRTLILFQAVNQQVFGNIETFQEIEAKVKARQAPVMKMDDLQRGQFLAEDAYIAKVKACIGVSPIGASLLAFAEEEGIEIIVSDTADANGLRGIAIGGQKIIGIASQADAEKRFGEEALLMQGQTLAHELAHKVQVINAPELFDVPPDIGSKLVATRLKEIDAHLRQNLAILEAVLETEGSLDLTSERADTLVGPIFPSILQNLISGSIFTSQQITPNLLAQTYREGFMTYAEHSDIAFTSYDRENVNYPLIDAVRAGTWPDLAANHPLLTDDLFMRLAGDMIEPWMAPIIAQRTREHFGQNVRTDLYDPLFTQQKLPEGLDDPATNSYAALYYQTLSEYSDNPHSTLLGLANALR